MPVANTDVLTVAKGEFPMDTPLVAGPPSDPIIYQPFRRANGTIGLLRVARARSGSATATFAEGIVDIGESCPGFRALRCYQPVGVNPRNPNHVLIADIGEGASGAMKESLDGRTFTTHAALTNAVTGNRAFVLREESFGGTVHAIAFDPEDADSILVGTKQRGVLFSRDGGRTWAVVPGSEQISTSTDFFFDRAVDASGKKRVDRVIISSFGRGLWHMRAETPATLTRFGGSGEGIGLGEKKAGIRIVGRFETDPSASFDGAAASATLLAVVRDSTSDDVSRLPITLVPDPRNTGRTFTYRSVANDLPTVRLIVSRVAAGVYNFRIEVSRATRAQVDGCPTPGLDMAFLLDDRRNPPIKVAATKDWICFGTGDRYLKTP
jgi:hypothetical protein